MSEQRDLAKLVKEAVPEIENALKSVPEPYRAAAFGSLLLGRISRAWPDSAMASPDVARPVPPGTELSPLSRPSETQVKEQSDREAAFLRAHSISESTLAELLDYRSGDILVTDLGRTAVEVQRKLAALVGLRNYVTQGQFRVSRDELAVQCRHFGRYDVKNFSTIMKSATHGGTVVFSKDGDSWLVTKPGERFVASVVRECLATIGASRQAPVASPGPTESVERAGELR